MEWLVLILAGIVFYKSYEANKRATANARAAYYEKNHQLLVLMHEVLSDFSIRHKLFMIPSLEAFGQKASINTGIGKSPCYTFRASLGYGILPKDISIDLKRHLQEPIDDRIYQFPLLDNGNAKRSVYLSDIVITSNEAIFKVFINDNLQVAQMIQNDLKQESRRKR